jgi:hypothetical protein
LAHYGGNELGAHRLFCEGFIRFSLNQGQPVANQMTQAKPFSEVEAYA